MKRCLGCMNLINDDAVICPECGLQLTEDCEVCPRCKKAVK